MDVRRLEAALIDVVVREGLRGVGAVLVHRDGHFSMSHALRRLDMRCGPFTWMRQQQQQRAVRRSSFRGPLEEAQGTLSPSLQRQPLVVVGEEEEEEAVEVVAGG